MKKEEINFEFNTHKQCKAEIVKIWSSNMVFIKPLFKDIP